MILMCPTLLQLVQYSGSLPDKVECVISTASGVGVAGNKTLSFAASLLHWGGDLLLSLASSVIVGTSVLWWAGVTPISLAISSIDILLLSGNSHSSNTC